MFIKNVDVTVVLVAIQAQNIIEQNILMTIFSVKLYKHSIKNDLPVFIDRLNNQITGNTVYGFTGNAYSIYFDTQYRKYK